MSIYIHIPTYKRAILIALIDQNLGMFWPPFFEATGRARPAFPARARPCASQIARSGYVDVGAP